MKIWQRILKEKQQEEQPTFFCFENSFWYFCVRARNIMMEFRMFAMAHMKMNLKNKTKRWTKKKESIGTKYQ